MRLLIALQKVSGVTLSRILFNDLNLSQVINDYVLIGCLFCVFSTRYVENGERDD